MKFAVTVGIALLVVAGLLAEPTWAGAAAPAFHHRARRVANSRLGTIVVNAEFRPVAFSGLPARYTNGQEISFKVTGDLNIRDVVRRTTLDVRMRLTGNTLRGTATGKILMTDFGFDPPSILGILRADNEVEIELRFVARVS